MGGGPSAGGGRAARALRLFLLFVLALAAIEYIFGSILDVSPLKNYLYTPLYNAAQPTFKKAEIRLNAHVIWSRAQSTPSLVHNVTSTDMPLCDSLPPDLGPIAVNKTELEIDMVEQEYPEIQWGGWYTPSNCTARHRVAIIVPYRDRQHHLKIFVNYMHPFLMKQQIEYGIFIIEQEGNKDFNRAKLMNIGFVESKKMVPGDWQCYIFHDVDLLPLDTRNMYSCPQQPRHMSAAIDKLNFTLPYKNIFGGVSALTTEQFTKVNGFSNKYWGWGGEDDDMFNRLKKFNYSIERYNMSIARYTMLEHKKTPPNPKRYKLLAQTSKVLQNDGLSTLKYDIIKVIKNHLYTYILANIDEHS